MIKVNLEFMVENLDKEGYVDSGMRIVIKDVNHPLLKRRLGSSGRRLARNGAVFIFEEQLARRLLKDRAAVLPTS